MLRRLLQGLHALFAFAQPISLDLAARYLSPEQLRLFGQMRRGEQLHSLRVLRDVLRDAESPDLAVAALLHDVGKTRYPLALWQKTLPVLVRPLFPACLIASARAIRAAGGGAPSSSTSIIPPGAPTY